MTNRLRLERSPYLKQHADNPVDWYPWSEEAFARAETENKPIFLSIGYSSCHWCHVMAHESFENESVAEILNRSFLSIKVDREERPDVDDTYMTFTQMLTGRGGWPMSVFLMPDKSPFFGGTYFPFQDRGEHPGFKTMLISIERLWKERKKELDEAAAYYQGALREAIGATEESKGDGPVDTEEVIDHLKQNFDPERGGFSRAPKFPPHSALELLLSLDPLDPMALKTLDEVARGGIHDHVGGGFHRYSTDGDWHLPHFEKMLYDNALLLKAFSIAEGGDLFRFAGEGIVAWMEREMCSDGGLFFSALDADSEGEEGKFYVWKQSEIMMLPNGREFAEAYQCRPPGNFHDEATGLLTGENILHLKSSAAPLRTQLDLLLTTRAKRVRPQLDDKALLGWNGLAISGLVAAGRVDLASRCAEAILVFEGGTGRLPRYVHNGEGVGEGFLEDYAYFALGLLDLEMVEAARRVAGAMIARFFDESGGGFYSVGSDQDQLFGRAKPVFDQPIPSPNSAAIRVLTRIGDLERAGRSLTAFSGWMARAPLACEGLFLAQLEFERAGGRLGPSFQILSLREGVVEVAVGLPEGWRLNMLEDETLLRAKMDGERMRVEIGDYAGEIELNLTGELELEFQLCSDRECLPISRRKITLS